MCGSDNSKKVDMNGRAKNVQNIDGLLKRSKQ